MNPTCSFESAIGPIIASYLALKKSLGRRFAAETAVLADLDRFLAARGSTPGVLSSGSFATWCLTLGHLTPTVRRNRMRIVRNFCLYQQRTHRDCFVPDPSGFPAPHTPRRPFIFSKDQIVRLLRAAAQLRASSTSPLPAEVYRLAIVLLYTAGLRRGELVRLALSDHDPSERTLLIRESKFHKSRLVALSKDAAHEVEAYLRARRRLAHDADAPLLVSRSGGLRGYTGAGLAQGLCHLFRSAEIHDEHGRLPRVHDIRHTHAVHVLLRWYRAGVDVQAKLPVLATAMGHVSVASTAYYLSFLEPVAQAASERFAQHCQHLFDAHATMEMLDE
jgi:integrase/recombinase XerD